METPKAVDATLVVQDKTSTALALPSFIDQNDLTGKQLLPGESITLPRLALAQSSSQEMTPDTSSFIDNLKLYEMFNNTTQEILGRGPLKFLPIKRRTVFIEFDPDDRNIPVDLDVPYDDARTKWTKDPDDPKKGIPPRAIEFSEFIILLTRDGHQPEPMILSIKCTNKFQKKAAERLKMLMNTTIGPVFSTFRTVESKSERNDSGTFAVYVVKNAGVMSDTPENRKLYEFAKKFSQQIEGLKVIDVQREPGADDFDPAEMEGAETGGTTNTSGM